MGVRHGCAAGSAAVRMDASVRSTNAERRYPDPSQYYFDVPLYGFLCCQNKDAGWRSCVIQSCCCSLWYAHCVSIHWIADDLGARAESAFGAAVRSAAFSLIPSTSQTYMFDAAGRRSGSFVSYNPFVDVVKTQAELDSHLISGSLRRDIIRRLYGVWRRSVPQDGEGKDAGASWLRYDPTADQGCAIFCAQCCFAPCARCQEIDAAMRWRSKTTGKDVRFANPCMCKCGFEEEWQNGVWRPPLGIDPANKLNLDSDVLYARKLPTGPAPPIMLRS